jgi:hypothetical protein
VAGNLSDACFGCRFGPEYEVPFRTQLLLSCRPSVNNEMSDLILELDKTVSEAECQRMHMTGRLCESQLQIQVILLGYPCSLTDDHPSLGVWVRLQTPRTLNAANLSTHHQTPMTASKIAKCQPLSNRPRSHSLQESQCTRSSQNATPGITTHKPAERTNYHHA